MTSNRNLYVWSDPGWYASRGEGRSDTITLRVNMDGWEDHEVSEAARCQGLGTPFFYAAESLLRYALGLQPLGASLRLQTEMSMPGFDPAGPRETL